MASVTEICNRALALLGEQKITNINDLNNVAELCATLYPAARDKCMEDRKWSFLLHRIIIAPMTIKPAFGYTSQFQIPSDCIALRSVDDGGGSGRLHWVREGDRILTDASEIYVEYTRYVDNPDLYTNGFIEAMTFKLAADLAMPITENRTTRDNYEADYFRKISEAGAIDGGQGRQEKIRSDSLLTARTSGGFLR